MKPAEYLDAAKQRLNITSDYELAKRFNVGRAAVSEMRTGIRAVPLDVAFRLAITLEMDPAQVVADLESQREKNPERRNFWTGFISRAAMVIGVMACTLALNFSGMQGNGAATHGGFIRRPKNA